MALIISLSGCEKGFLGNNEKEYREVQHLDFPIQAIKTLNPATSQDRDTYYISRLIYDGDRKSVV